MSSDGLRPQADGRSVLLSVRVQPGARREGATGSWNGCLKLAVRAPPADGRANEAVGALLARLFGLRPSAVVLVRGHSSRSKIFRLECAPETARARLTALLESPTDSR